MNKPTEYSQGRKFCACVRGCSMAKWEARRYGVECRYRYGEVKPVGWFVKPKASNASAPHPKARR